MLGVDHARGVRQEARRRRREGRQEVAVAAVARSRAAIAGLIVPGLCVLTFSLVVPLGFSAYFSITDSAGFGEYHIVGADNYREILGDEVFWRSLRNVVLLIAVTIFLQNPIAFVLAAVLSRLSARVSRILRTVYFVPAVLSLVVVAKLWVDVFNPTFGVLDKLLRAVGLDALAVSWLSNPRTAVAAVLWIIVWQGFGWALLFYYAALMTVPRELEDAARVDGASWPQIYRHVIIPYIAPVIAAVIVNDVISSMKQMELIYLTTAGGPGQLTQFLGVYLYQKAFVTGEYGYGNALSVVFVVVSLVLSLVVLRGMRALAR
ncbi:MAG: sugar ABC transporter permease [Deltaproteobacteria bacterium]|nr:MAG: sugar ABC transporter permease [Deltaproteobacteria bacterium]